MLTHVDVFLGVAMVMLAVSLLLTIVTQVVSLVFNLRGTALRNGLAELFETLNVVGGKEVANKILKYKLVAEAGFIKRLAPAVTRADFLRLLDAEASVLGISNVQKQKLVDARKEIEAWFDGTMTRVAHRFTLNTRVVTIVGAFVAAFLLHLDSFDLVTKLYKDSDLRARMAGAAGTIVEQGARVLTGPSVFTSAATTLATQKDLTEPVPVISNRGEAEIWIRQNAKGDDKRAQELLAAYDQDLATAAGPGFKTWLTEAGNIKQGMETTSFRLIPPAPYRPFGYHDLIEFLGVFVSACLLSLGAPFWFNALKTVSNLRPTIAAQVDAREPKDREAAV